MPREIPFEQKGGQIFVDGAPFDWELDAEAIDDANKQAANPEFMRAIHLDIMEHFLRSLTEVLGFRPSMRKVNEALKSGFISK